MTRVPLFGCVKSPSALHYKRAMVPCLRMAVKIATSGPVGSYIWQSTKAFCLNQRFACIPIRNLLMENFAVERFYLELALCSHARPRTFRSYTSCLINA